MTDAMAAPQAPTLKGLSPSSLDLWEQCERRFYLEKFDGRSGGGSSIDSLKGTFVHLVLEHLMKLPSGKRSIAAARAIAREHFAGFIASREWREWVEETGYDDLKGFRRIAWESICGYFACEDPDSVEVSHTERFMEAELNGVPVRGIIDRLELDVFEDVVVTDYKAGKVPLPWFRAPKLRQLNIYGALVRAVDGTLPGEGRLVFTTFSEVISTTITPETADAAEQDLRAAWDGIHESLSGGFEAFEAKPGPLCGWCPFAPECPEGQSAIHARHAEGKSPGPAFSLIPPPEGIVPIEG